MSLPSCPSEEALQQLCEGTLSPDQEVALSTHLDECDTCLEAVESIGNAKSFDSELVGLNESTEDSDALRRKLAAIKASKPFASATSSRVSVTDLLPWLEESENGIGRIAEYELSECVGRGGMGAVFKAYDSNLERTVALKIMSPSLLVDEAAPERFLREARAAAGINSPHVVSVFAVSKIRDLPYLVMEFVDGESLQQRLTRDGCLPMSEVVELSQQIATGLAAAHGSGVVHRDIKPANILIEAFSGAAKITDFGLARSVNSSSLTRSGLLVGTPDFIAPEQVNSASTEPDHRADLFSLGSLIYCMCAARVPFGGESMMATLTAVCSTEPEPIEKLNPHVPDWLAGLIRKLHSKDANDRPASATEVLKLLEQAKVTASDVTANIPVPPPVQAAETQRPTSKLPLAARITLAWLLASLALPILLLLALIVWNSFSGPEFVDSSDELFHLLDETEGDVEIILTSAEPYYLPSLYTEGRNISIAAEVDVDAVIVGEVDGDEDAALTFVHGSLQLSGISFELEGARARSEEPRDKDHPEANGLISCEDVQLTVTNCKFRYPLDGPCLRVEQGNATITNCEIQAAEVAIALDSYEPTDLAIHNSVVVAEVNLAISSPLDASLILERNTFFGFTTFAVSPDEEEAIEGGISIEALNNQFDAIEGLIVADDVDWSDPATLSEHLRWTGSGNLFPPAGFVKSEDGEQVDWAKSLADWNRVSSVDDTDAFQDTPGYVVNRDELINRMEDCEVTAQDLLVREIPAGFSGGSVLTTK